MTAGKMRGEADDGDSAAALPSISMRIDHYLDELLKKKVSKRVDALTSIIRILSSRMQTEFVEKNFATLLYRFLISLKKGPARERDLASNALGLLAMTIHCRDKAHELYNESTPLLSKALNSNSNTSKELDGLAIITFFCNENSMEVENMMQIIWDNIHQGSDSTATGNTDRKMCLISAWSFLLSTLDGWRLSCRCWKGAISYFSRLLEDEVLHGVALEALFLIYENGSLHKFSGDLVRSKDEAVQYTNIAAENNSSTMELKEEIDKLLKNNISDSKSDVSKYFQEKSQKIGKQEVVLSTYAQRVQENELVRDVFEFRMKVESAPRCELYEAEEEKIAKRYIPPAGSIASIPGVDYEDDGMLVYISRRDRGIRQRIYKSKNAPISKARTQLRNKKRTQAQERHLGYFISEEEEF
ncbi:hypothetical protein CDL15_Pgr003335 [Punica granatum]|uniref:Interferon-related developmental regulator N-terminal domain-containing protein n=1 Tax=Punica granatum TaxID=22663 RepID=A0A218X2K6_PUNGR|nr:hypothetical protein CDL15_Pgr003335 [Punica granatum]